MILDVAMGDGAAGGNAKRRGGDVLGDANVYDMRRVRRADQAHQLRRRNFGETGFGCGRHGHPF